MYVSKKTGTKNKKNYIILSVLLSNLTAAADIGIIILFSKFFSDSNRYDGILDKFIQFFSEESFLLPLLVIFRYIFVYFQSYILKLLELNVQNNLKSYLLQEVFDKSNYSIADAYFFINKLTGHIGYFYSSLANFLNFIIQTTAYLLFLIISDFNTIITFGFGALFLIFPSRFLILKARKYMHDSYKLDQQSDQEIQRIIENMFVIKILNKAFEELNNFNLTLLNYKNSQIKNHIYGSFGSFLPSFITLFVFSILLSFFKLSKTITLDFIGVTLRLFQTLGAATTALNKLVNSHVHISEFYKIDKNRQIVNKQNFVYKNIETKNSLEVKNVSFQYFNSQTSIFDNLNLEIKKNTHNIIIGENGSGKSTLLGLLAGVLYPQRGKITSYEKNYGYIGPVPLIFDSSLKYNLIYGNKKIISEEEILNLCKEFSLFENLNNENLNLEINNKSLSSGQMQKVAFIRALLSKPNVLLLDEATSNLDIKSKEKVFEIIKKQEITIINCTHDPNSFESVDSIYKIINENEKRKLVKLN